VLYESSCSLYSWLQSLLFNVSPLSSSESYKLKFVRIYLFIYSFIVKSANALGTLVVIVCRDAV